MRLHHVAKLLIKSHTALQGHIAARGFKPDCVKSLGKRCIASVGFHYVHFFGWNPSLGIFSPSTNSCWLNGRPRRLCCLVKLAGSLMNLLSSRSFDLLAALRSRAYGPAKPA